MTKPLHLLVLSLAAVASLSPLAGLANTTSDVYRLTASLAGSIQGGVLSNEVIQDVQITTDDLINFGLGRPLGTPIRKTETLATAEDHASGIVNLIVYDTQLGARLATLGVVEPTLILDGFKKGERLRRIIGDLVLLPTGDGTNGLSGGVIHLSALLNVQPNGRFNRLKADLLGTLGANFYRSNLVVTVTNVIDGGLTNTIFVTNILCCVTNTPVAVTRGKLTAGGKSLGLLIEEPPPPLLPPP